MKAKIVGEHEQTQATSRILEDFRQAHVAKATYVPPGESVKVAENVVVYVDPFFGNNRQDMLERGGNQITIVKIGPFLVRTMGEVEIYGPAMVGPSSEENLHFVKRKNWALLRDLLVVPFAAISVFFILLCLNFAKKEIHEQPVLMFSLMTIIPAFLGILCYSKSREIRPKIKACDNFEHALRELSGGQEKFGPI